MTLVAIVAAALCFCRGCPVHKVHDESGEQLGVSRGALAGQLCPGEIGYCVEARSAAPQRNLLSAGLKAHFKETLKRAHQRAKVLREPQEPSASLQASQRRQPPQLRKARGSKNPKVD